MQLACSDPGLGTLENHYWRAFNMNTFTGGQAYDVTSVEFGIEQAESLFGTDQPLTVNLYANHGSPFPGRRLAIEFGGQLRRNPRSQSGVHDIQCAFNDDCACGDA